MSALHRRRQIAHLLAWRPEWPAAVLAAVAWALMLIADVAPLAPTPHAHHHRSGGGAPTMPSVTLLIGSWALMSVAMMVPLTLPAVRHVAVNSFRWRRRRATAIYISAYVTVWAAFGLAAIPAVEVLKSRTGVGERSMVIASLAIATTWQLTPWKRRSVLACRRTVPLSPSGVRADVACARFGVHQAGRCLVSCWPLMLLMAVIGHGAVAVMAVLTAILLVEDRAPSKRRTLKPIATSYAAAAIGLALLG